MDVNGLRATALVTLLALAVAAPHAVAAPKPKLKPPGALELSAATTDSVSLSWRDRSKGERRYELRWRTPGGPWTLLRLARSSSSWTLRGLAPGSVREVQGRACARKRCSAWSQVVSARSSDAVAGTVPGGGTVPGAGGPGPVGPSTSLGGCSVFPAAPSGGPQLPDQRAWNQDVSASPRDTSAAARAFMATFGGTDLHPDFGSEPGVLYGIPYVTVPGTQPPVPIVWGNEGEDYGDQSDPGPYPIPPDAPKEAGPGDEHVVVVERDSCTLYELYNADFLGAASGNAWAASSGTRWDLDSAALRTEGWTSADAAGLPILPGLVRYDEVAAGEVTHAIRATFSPTRSAYIRPATHEASSNCAPSSPPMGMRLRLGATYDLSALSGQSLVIARALKRYGLIVADNGSDWYFTGAADPRWDNEDLEQLKDIPGSAFEVVQSQTPVGC